jgi:hypothetical protein
MAEPTVVVIPGQSTPPESENSSGEASQEQAIQFGQLLESHRQVSERQAQLEAELAREREARAATESQLAAISAQTQSILSAIQQAAAEESEAEPEDVTPITPEVEPAPEPEPEPKREPSIWEKVCDRLNGL